MVLGQDPNLQKDPNLQDKTRLERPSSLFDLVYLRFHRPAVESDTSRRLFVAAGLMIDERRVMANQILRFQTARAEIALQFFQPNGS